MNHIYPFKAITLLNGVNLNIHDLFPLHQQNTFINNLEIYENKIRYINRSVNKTLFIHNTDNFYCCRISNKHFVVSGLIALINTNLINKMIFKHERCIETKKEIYLELFKKYNTQIAPITLVHEDSLKIKNNLERIFLEKIPFLSVHDNEYKYEIWTVNDICHYKELYSHINAFLVADGHHRLSSINALKDNKLITSFLISAAQIKSANIYREYNQVTVLSKKKLAEFLNDYCNPIKANFINSDTSSNNFLCRIDNSIFKVKNYTNQELRAILEFLDKSINYTNNELNFHNYQCNEINNLFISRKEVSLLIPSHEKINKIQGLPLYPPHSTLFYPKLPDGLISAYV